MRGFRKSDGDVAAAEVWRMREPRRFCGCAGRGDFVDAESGKPGGGAAVGREELNVGEIEMEYKLRRLKRELASPGKALDFYRDTMELPDGRVEKWDFVSHKKGGGACVVPVLPDGRILMIHQYRPAVDRETTELPAGAFDAEDPDFAVTASRELEEETGYRCGKISRLVRLDTAIAWCNEKVEVYLAEDLCKAGDQALDEAEEIGVEAIPLAELKRRIFEGEIRDAKTVSGILAYLAVLSER